PCHLHFLFLLKTFKIPKLLKVSIAKVAEFKFVIIQRMPGKINAHHFFFLGEGLQGSPFLTLWYFRFGNVDLHLPTKKGMLGGVQQLLESMPKTYGLIHEQLSIVIFRKVLRTMNNPQGIESSGQGQAFK